MDFDKNAEALQRDIPDLSTGKLTEDLMDVIQDEENDWGEVKISVKFRESEYEVPFLDFLYALHLYGL